jgi:hypothetical protein
VFDETQKAIERLYDSLIADGPASMQSFIVSLDDCPPTALNAIWRETGMTIAMHAVEQELVPHLLLLTQRRCDMRVQNPWTGMSALHVAAQCPMALSVFEVVLDAVGAKGINLYDCRGCTPLHLLSAHMDECPKCTSKASVAMIKLEEESGKMSKYIFSSIFGLARVWLKRLSTLCDFAGLPFNIQADNLRNLVKEYLRWSPLRSRWLCMLSRIGRQHCAHCPDSPQSTKKRWVQDEDVG